jgi:PAS domain S-box-containing protein
MVRSLKIDRQRASVATNGKHARGSLDAEIIIANAPDPVFVSDLEGKILQANDAVSELLGFRPDELLEQSLSRFISNKEKREFTAALRAVVEHGVTRNAVLHPRGASGRSSDNAQCHPALRDPASGQVIGAIGILRDMRELDKARAYAESLIKNAPDPVFVSDLEGKILQANDAVSELLGFRPDELLEQSLSRFISPEELREFTAALREVVERGVTRNALLHPRSASGEVFDDATRPHCTTPQASNWRHWDSARHARTKVVSDLEASRPSSGQDPRPGEFEEVVVGQAQDDRLGKGDREASARSGPTPDRVRARMNATTTWPEPAVESHHAVTADEFTDSDQLAMRYAQLQDQLGAMEVRIRRGEQRRKALLHLITDFDIANKRLARQRKAMLHILIDYEQDRRRLVQQADRLMPRGAHAHILQDSHRSTLSLEASRKAMIHIISDLQDTTAEIQREHELRDKKDNWFRRQACHTG